MKKNSIKLVILSMTLTVLAACGSNLDKIEDVDDSGEMVMGYSLK